jgi:hypothetical protein
VQSPRAIDPTLPEQLESIILRALAKSPEDRYSSMSALAGDLQRFLLGPTGPARPAATPTRPSLSQPSLSLPPAPPTPALTAPPSGAMRALGLIGVVVLVAGAAGGLVWWRLQGGAPAAVVTAPDQPTPPLPPPEGPTGQEAAPLGQEPPAAASPAPPPPTATPTATAPAAAPAGPAAPDELLPPSDAPLVTGTPPAESPSPRARPRPSGAARARPSGAAAHYARALEHRMRGEEAEALLAFRRALSTDELPRDDRDEALRQVMSLAKKFGEVEVSSAVPGARITVDGRVRGVTPLPAPLLLTVGEHVIVLSRAGYKPATRKVIIEANRRLPLRFEQ